MGEAALLVVQLGCDCCGTVYVVPPGEQDDLRTLSGTALAEAVWPRAQSDGWATTDEGRRRCSACVREQGVGPLPFDPGWREALRRTWS